LWREWEESLAKPETAIGRVYRRIDESIGKLLEAAPPDAVVMVVSDHGFGPYRLEFRANCWLQRQGWLHTWVEGEASRLSWDQTRAYLARGQEYGIRINLRGRERYGIVEPGEKYEELRKEIIQALEELAADGPLFQALPREEVYHGPEVAKAADILLLPRQDGSVLDAALFPADSDVLAPVDRWYDSGWHHPRGVFIAAGGCLRTCGRVATPITLMDLAPTIMRLLGICPPAWMDGRALDTLFELPPPERVYPLGEERSHFKAGPLISRTSLEPVVRNLAALGYLGDDDIESLLAAETQGSDKELTLPRRLELAAEGWSFSPGDLTAVAREREVLLDISVEHAAWRAAGALAELGGAVEVGRGAPVRICARLDQASLVGEALAAYPTLEHVVVDLCLPADMAELSPEDLTVLQSLRMLCKVHLVFPTTLPEWVAAQGTAIADAVMARPSMVPKKTEEWVRWLLCAPSTAYLSYGLHGYLKVNHSCPAGSNLLALTGNGKVFPCLPLARAGEWCLGKFDGAHWDLHEEEVNAFLAARAQDRVAMCAQCDHPGHYQLFHGEPVDIFSPLKTNIPAHREGLRLLRTAVPARLELGSTDSTLYCIQDDQSAWHHAEIAWRWTTRQSAVYLHVHPSARVLFIRLVRLPSDVFSLPIRLDVQVAGISLGTQTLGGVYPDVAHAGLCLAYLLPHGQIGGPVRVDLTLDRIWKPSEVDGTGDTRELGVGVSEIWVDGPEFYRYALELLSTPALDSPPAEAELGLYEVRVTNRGQFRWPAHRCAVASRWFRSGQFVLEGPHTPLPEDLLPGASTTVTIAVPECHAEGPSLLIWSMKELPGSMNAMIVLCGCLGKGGTLWPSARKFDTPSAIPYSCF